MPGQLPNAADAAQRVAAALEKRGTTYALGGATARAIRVWLNGMNSLRNGANLAERFESNLIAILAQTS
jgi:hypothetical protein